MSWSTYTVAPAASADEAIDALEVPGNHLPESDEQLTAAKAAAKGIVSSGALGKAEYWMVSLSGHANAGHEPTSGWANDTITVNVSQSNAQAYEQYVSVREAAKQDAS